ncbi:MAG: hypothetical protein OEW88_04560 [Gammaproteobacteria bacterium]|nr:hypothetical protein [Gammaproteobacteria bacterium]
MTRLHEKLIPVFMHALHHSLESALEVNGVDAVVKFTSGQSDTTAAIVTAFMADVTGEPSLPVHTVTEDRQLYGQRTD